MYQKDQWETLRATDAELHDTWEEWNAQGVQIIADFKSRGIPYVQIPVDVDELNQYCKAQGVPNNSETRCKFLRTIEKQNDTGLVPVKDRNDMVLEPRNEEEQLMLEEKLNLHQQRAELSLKAAQKWAANPGAS